jgi:AMMECR1 domain-containing protein
LTDFEPVSDPLDWDLHVHGIRIKFQSGGRRYSATYLPDVALEQGWNKEETILSLMEKSGWSGKTSDWRNMGIEVVRYQGKKAYLSYEEYAKFKTWTEESGKGQ